MNANDLEDGDYVLVPEDVHDAGVPLLVAEDYDQPQLWQVDDWYSDGPDAEMLYLDGPGRGDSEELEILPDDYIRRVLPGQDHETW